MQAVARALVTLSLCIVVCLNAIGTCQDGELLEVREVALDRQTLTQLGEHTARDYEQVVIQNIAYKSDGLKVKGYLAKPKQTNEKLPCVIWNRGGNREFGALDDELAAIFLARIASWGYLVVAPQYRGNGGGEGREEFGGADVSDVLNLIPLLEKYRDADAQRIGMIGWSRGGLMTCLALCKTDRIRTAVIGSGMYDAQRAVRERPEMETEVIAQLVPDFVNVRQQALDARSPIKWADKLNAMTPILLLHGTEDDKVSPLEATDMAARLVEVKHPFRLVLFEKAGHRLHLDHGQEVDELTRMWLDKYLKHPHTHP